MVCVYVCFFWGGVWRELGPGTVGLAQGSAQQGATPRPGRRCPPPLPCPPGSVWLGQWRETAVAIKFFLAQEGSDAWMPPGLGGSGTSAGGAGDASSDATAIGGRASLSFGAKRRVVNALKKEASIMASLRHPHTVLYLGEGVGGRDEAGECRGVHTAAHPRPRQAGDPARPRLTVRAPPPPLPLTPPPCCLPLRHVRRPARPGHGALRARQPAGSDPGHWRGAGPPGLDPPPGAGLWGCVATRRRQCSGCAMACRQAISLPLPLPLLALPPPLPLPQGAGPETAPCLPTSWP